MRASRPPPPPDGPFPGYIPLHDHCSRGLRSWIRSRPCAWIRESTSSYCAVSATSNGRLCELLLDTAPRWAVRDPHRRSHDVPVPRGRPPRGTSQPRQARQRGRRGDAYLQGRAPRGHPSPRAPPRRRADRQRPARLPRPRSVPGTALVVPLPRRAGHRPGRAWHPGSRPRQLTAAPGRPHRGKETPS